MNRFEFVYKHGTVCISRLFVRNCSIILQPIFTGTQSKLKINFKDALKGILQ